MKTRTLLIVTIFSFLMLGGCASPNKSEENEVPRAVITNVEYDAADRDAVVISGEYFKYPSDNRNDVICSLNAGDWQPAKKIVDSSGLKYKAVLPYGQDFAHVWIRVYGLRNEYSEAYLLHR